MPIQCWPNPEPEPSTSHVKSVGAPGVDHLVPLDSGTFRFPVLGVGVGIFLLESLTTQQDQVECD